MTIDLSDREQAMLSAFAAKQYNNAPDNMGTCTPIHVVERRDRQFAEGEYDSDAWLRIDDGECELYEDFDSMIEGLRTEGQTLPEYNEVEFTYVNEIWISCEAEYCEAFKIDARPGAIIDTYTPIAFFFIRDEAMLYMYGYQAHNCADCRIYTYGLGYSNRGDLPVFRALLMRMGQELNGSSAPEAAPDV